MLKGISSEADKTFKQLSQLDEIDFNKLINNNFKDFIKENELADKSLVKFLEDANYGTKDLESYQQYLKDTGKSTSTFADFTKKAGSVLKSFGASLLSIGVNWLIGKVIDVAVTAFDNLIHSAEHCKERVDELMSSYQSAIDKANNNAKTIEDLASRYEELSKGVNNLGGTYLLTAEEAKEYQDICNQIADMFPTLVQGYTNEGNAILSLKGNVEQLRDAYKEAQQEAYNLLIASGKDSNGNDIVQNAQNVINGSKFLGNKSSRGAIEENDAYREFLDAIVSKNVEQIQAVVNKYNSKVTSSNFILDKLGINWSDLYGTEELVATEEELYAIQQQTKAMIQTNQAEIDSVISDTRILANAYLMTNEDYAKLDDQSKNAASIIVNSINEGIVSGFEDKEDVGEYVAKIVDSIKDHPEIQDALVGLFSTNFSKKSVNEAKELIDIYIKSIAEAIDENEFELKVRLGFDDIVDTANKLRDSIRQITDDHGMQNREEYSTLSEYTKEFTQKQVELWLEATLGAENATQAIEMYKAKLAEVNANADSITFSDIFSLKNADDTLTNLGKISESIDTIQNAYKTLSNAIDEYNEEGAFSIDTLQSVISLGDDWLDYLVDEEGKLKLDKESLEQLTLSRLNDMRVQAINNVIDNVSNIQDEAGANEYLTSTNYALADSYEAVAKAKLETARASMANAVEAGSLSQASMDAAMSKAEADIDKINKLFDNTNIGASSIMGGSGSGSGKSSAKSEFSEAIDFFERRVKLLDESLSHLKSSMENVSGSFGKNNLIDAELSITGEKFNNYTDALSMYTQKANEAFSKLPSDIASKVKDGAVALTDFIGDGNKDVVEAIKEYESWANKVGECKQELAELQKEIRKLELEKFNNIISDFTDQFDIRNNSKDLISKRMDLLKESGELIGESFFTAQIDQSKKQLELLENEKAQLVNQMSSAISSGRVNLLPSPTVM